MVVHSARVGDPNRLVSGCYRVAAPGTVPRRSLAKLSSAVGNNVGKRALFTAEERMAVARKVTGEYFERSCKHPRLDQAVPVS
ncbi:hypothetical protein ABZV58_23735 [Nocardia sp. NPDC004654]|uniref:hypothetical protein n=1 Tax=Nocardia sp. NPDC004654 TaxID=3154776 RepID=UPI0033B96278